MSSDAAVSSGRTQRPLRAAERPVVVDAPVPGTPGQHTSRQLQFAGEKIGVEANLPIDRVTGALNPQVRNPRIIADTCSGWVRLNFVLGPWSGPEDDALHSGQTWREAYRTIVAGLREHALNLYGLIGAEAVSPGPEDRFRLEPPDGDAQDPWLDAYVANFVAIVELFHQEFRAFESFNEPDDWHGQSRSWIHPGWFAIMLQRLHAAVRARPHLDAVKLVSGPLEGLEISNNGAVGYLRDTYRAGKRFYGWGDPGRPFPFDGVGYHLYVQQGYTPDLQAHERSVRSVLARYLGQMHTLIRAEEGRDKPLYVSEIGWRSSVDQKAIQAREAFQANAIRVGLDVLASDPLVELGVWFCTQDFQAGSDPHFFGLYRMGDPDPAGRKPAHDAFVAVCRQPIAPLALPQYTNQMVINAFYRAAVTLGLADRWSLLNRTGLNLRALIADRASIYRGRPVQDLPNLSEAEREAVVLQLAAQAPGTRDAAPADGGTGRAPQAAPEPDGSAVDPLLSAPGAVRARLPVSAGMSDHARHGGHDTGTGRDDPLEHCREENEILEHELLSLITEHRASLRGYRALLIGGGVGLLCVLSCVLLLGASVLLVLLRGP